MDIKTYLPDELGKQAKKANINFSALLRAAVEDELVHLEALDALGDDMGEVILDLEDENGRSYKGRFTGKLLASGDRESVYRKDDGTLCVYDLHRLKVFTIEADDLGNYLSGDEYIEVMHALGLTAIVDI